jgi:two-component system KDP operon response regulator KdpE
MKILIVEDQPDWCQLLGLFLRSMGHQTIEVENGQEAILRIATAQPDLVFMDLGLPDMNGVEVIATLKRNPETSQIPIAILSASPVSVWGPKALKAGAARYLTKPASAFAITETIDKFTSI